MWWMQYLHAKGSSHWPHCKHMDVMVDSALQKQHYSCPVTTYKLLEPSVQRTRVPWSYYFKAFSNIYATLYGALCYIILYACGVCHMFCSSKISWLLMKEISKLAIIRFEMTESSLPLFSQLCESSRWRRCSISPVELDLVDEHASESQLLFGAPSVTTVWLFDNLLFVVCWQMLAMRQQRRPLRTWRTPSRTLDL